MMVMASIRAADQVSRLLALISAGRPACYKGYMKAAVACRPTDGLPVERAGIGYP